MLGYNMGYNKKYLKRNLTKASLYAISNEKLNFIFVFYVFTVLIKYAYFLKVPIFDIKGMVNVLLIGLYDQHIGYSLSLDTTQPFTVNWSVYFLIAIIDQLFFIIGFLKWRDMNRFKKYLFIIFVLMEIFYWMGRGTNFGVISMITTLVFSLMYKFKVIKLTLTQIIKSSLVIIFLLIGSVAIFSFNMNGRRNGSTLNYEQFNLETSSVNEYDVIFSIIPKPLHDTYMYVVYYLSQGYYHTCLAFDLDFKSTYFLGNNPALISLVSIFNVDVSKDTYVYRLREKGVDPQVNWHSAYTWYANDVSFLGVPFLLFIIGYLFGFSWNLSLNGNDFLSKLIFIIFGNMLLYLFANNTYLSSVFYSFMFIFPIWYFTRVRRFKIN
jgi:hypothetical protein